jgi:alanine racemase
MRPTFATVSLEAIASNYRLASRLAPASKCIAVIKANAYGHGMVRVAQHLQDMAPAFAVAFIDEAIQLRDAGISKPILVMQGVHRAADLGEVIARNLWLMLNQQQQVEWLLSSELDRPIRTWLKIDTGMHHLGLMPDEIDLTCADLESSVNVQQGLVICTHLACSDDLEDPMTRHQVDLIRSRAGKYSFELSIANSAAILHWPEAHAEWNRPGYMLYGSCPGGSFDNDALGLQPAMSMHSEIIAIRNLNPGDGVGYGLDWVATKPSKIGTIAIGYGDGYPRHAPNGTPVLVNGRRVPLVGRVSMDAIGVDLSGLENVKVGDPVELWGENITLNELAAAAGTIGYEILAGLTGRVPLHY